MEKNKNVNAGHRQRIKERFLTGNQEGFHAHELLEIILFYIVPRKDTNKLAHTLVDKYGSVQKVLEAPTEELMQFAGLTRSGAESLKILPQLFERVKAEKQKAKAKLDSFSDIVNFCAPIVSSSKEEEMHLIMLDPQNRVCGVCELKQGTPNMVCVDKREILFKMAQYKATAVVVLHTHPQGKCDPSKADDAFTKDMVASLSALNMLLTDHIIINTKGEFYSYLQAGLIGKYLKELAKE